MNSVVLSPGTAALVLFGGFFLLLILRVPVAFALGLASLPVLLIEPRLSPMVLFNEMFKSYNSFILLAVPFFLLTANLMNVGGITDRMIGCPEAWSGIFQVGWRRSTSCFRFFSLAFLAHPPLTRPAKANCSSRHK